jgi:membrane-bound ClpP family serine protease
MSQNTQTILVVVVIALLGAFIGDLVGFNSLILGLLAFVWELVISSWKVIGVTGLVAFLIGWLFFKSPLHKNSAPKDE